MESPLRVAYVSDQFSLKEGYGLTRYANELYTHLQRVPGIEMIPCSLWGRRRAKVAHVPGMRYAPLGNQLTMKLWHRWRFPPLEWWAHGISLVHSLELGYPVATRKPWIVTIHDIGPLTHPHYFWANASEKMRRALAMAASKADLLLCVSQASADELQNYLKLDLRDRVRVVFEGVSAYYLAESSAAELAEIDSRLPVDAPFFLFTGSANPRKNLVRMIEAFEQVAADLPHHLVMTGRLHWDFEPMVEVIARSPYQARIHRLGFLTEAQLRALYQRADVYLYLSLMEGFGLPILEAMACGCPVVASKVSSMPEVGGGAAHWVDPYDVAAIAQAMLHLAQERAYAAELSTKGRARARELSWQTCAERTATIYRELGA